MNSQIAASLMILASIPTMAAGQVSGVTNANGCIDLLSGSTIKARGRLTYRHFPGPPNYENVRTGDADEAAYILVIPDAICVDDGRDGFADAKVKFRTVHVYADHSLASSRLRSAVGKQVTITGAGFAAENGHHRAPLVMEATSVLSGTNR